MATFIFKVVEKVFAHIILRIYQNQKKDLIVIFQTQKKTQIGHLIVVTTHLIKCISKIKNMIQIQEPLKDTWITHLIQTTVLQKHFLCLPSATTLHQSNLDIAQLSRHLTKKIMDRLVQMLGLYIIDQMCMIKCKNKKMKELKESLSNIWKNSKNQDNQVLINIKQE